MQLVPSGRSLVVGIALVLIAIGLYGLARETSLFAVSTIEVEGGSAGSRRPGAAGAALVRRAKPGRR